MFVIITLTLCAITAIVFSLANILYHGLSSRLTKVKPGNVSTEVIRARNIRDRIFIALNTLLITSISLLTLVSTLNVTILNPDFVAGELKKFDISAIGTELLSKQYSDQIAGAVNKLSPGKITQTASAPPADEVYSQASIQTTLTQLGPELTDEVSTAAYSVEDYVLGKQSDLDAVILLGNLQDALKQNLSAAITQSPPSALQNASPEEIRSYVDSVYQEHFSNVPAEIKLSSNTSTGLFITSIHGIRLAAMISLQLPWILLALILLLIIGIILIHRDFKSALWSLGITLGISGALDFLYSFIAKEASMHTAVLRVLPALNLWFIQIVVDVLAHMKQPSFILLGAGIALFIISFFWIFRRRAHNPEAIDARLQ